MLARYDLAQSVARRMFWRLLGMNFCGSQEGLVRRVMDQHPNLDRERVKLMVARIAESEN